MVSNQESRRQCVSCGRPLDWNASICPYCGHDYRYKARASQTQKKSGSAMWAVVIIAIVVLVVIIVPMVLYMMVIGFGGTDGLLSTPGINVLRKSSIPGGFMIELTAPTSTVVWSDVFVELSDGSNVITWINMTNEEFTGVGPEVWHYGSGQALGSLSVFLNATDLAGDGRIGIGDHIDLSVGGGSFATDTVYTLVLGYKPTAEPMITYTFSG